MSTSLSILPTVVVVGGGGAGGPLVHDLSSLLDPLKYKLVLVTSRPYFTHLVACIRMVITDEEKLEDRILMPYQQNFVNHNGELVVDTVVRIEDGVGPQKGKVVLASGTTIPYSVLVLTPGSTWEGPLDMPSTRPELNDWVRTWRQRFESSNDIVLVGGGAIAVEYAGEIKDLWPSKNVTIVHSHAYLLNDAYPVRWRVDVGRRIVKRGVQLLTNDYVDDMKIDSTGHLTTRNGTRIIADLIIPCRGGRPNTAFIQESLGGSVVNNAGRVRVRPTFQLLSHPHIFAAGDVIDWPEQKQVGKYYTHASITAANVRDVLEAKVATKRYKGSYELIVITIGRMGGAAYFGVLWGLMFGDWISTLIKSKGLMIKMTRKRMGL